MSGYNGRRAPNVSQYVAQLNTIPPPQEPAVDQPTGDEAFDLFTRNTEFNTVDSGVDFELDFPIDFDAAEPADTARRNGLAGSIQPKMDLNNMAPDIQFPDFSGFPNPIVEASMPHLAQPQPNNLAIPPHFSSSVSPIPQVPDHNPGKKRKLDSSDLISQHSFDEHARVAAEEDKRRRNTAASARFRVKKKQREQALEKTAKDMTEKVSVLESKVQQLETENTWLKGLILEKNGGQKSSKDIKAILEKREGSSVERSNDARTDGVGTEANGSKA